MAACLGKTEMQGQQTSKVLVLLFPGRADERQHSAFVCEYPCSGSSSPSCPQAQEALDSYHPGFQVSIQNTDRGRLPRCIQTV